MSATEPEALLAYVQLRALVGGTTSMQGWPTANRKYLQVLRNIDDEGAGGTSHDLIYTSTLTLKPLELAKRAQAQNNGAGFIYHCGEGAMGSNLAQLRKMGNRSLSYEIVAQRSESVSQPLLKDKAFSTFLDQNPPFELRPEWGVRRRQPMAHQRQQRHQATSERQIAVARRSA